MHPSIPSASLISVCVPLYNEEESVEPLYTRIRDALTGAGLRYEILLINDGSTDSTLEIAAGLAGKDPALRVIDFRGNYGQTPAMAAGIDHARGEFVVTMDGDLQNDPSDIPTMLNELTEEFDLVVGWRRKRRDKLITRKLPSWVANWLIGKVTGVPIRDNGCSLKVYRASVIRQVPLYSEMHRFIPAMASITGARVREVPVQHHARQFGESKYGLSRIYKVFLDLLAIKTVITFAQRPMIWFALLASPFLLAGMIVLVASFAGATADGTLFSLPLAGTGLLLAIAGVFLLMTGALGELIYSTGDLDMSKYSALTAVMTGHAVAPPVSGPTTADEGRSA